MSGKSNAHETTVLNILRATNVTAPAATYVGLFTVAPSDSGGGTEVTGNGYARQACGFAAPTGAPRSISNAAEILFPVQTPGGYGSVVAVGIFSASSGGSMLYWTAIPAVPFAVNDQARFAPGALTVQED